MNQVIFKLSSLTKTYKRLNAVSDLSLEGYTGEILGFLGPNGAGKTTTIRMMTGLIQPNSGTVEINGYDINTQYEQAMQDVGCIVETPHLYEYMTGLENIKLFASILKIEEHQIQKVLQLSGLNKRINDKVKNYSLGMKQRLGIAIALLNNPKLLILDEPTNGLDPLGIRELRTFLKKLAHEEHVSILVSSHILFEMEQLCDRVAIISEGTLLAVTPLAALKENQTLEDLFIELTGGECYE